MMKKLLAIVLLMTVSTVGFSQIKLGPAVSYLIPTGDDLESTDAGYGISAIGQFDLPKFAITGEFGWQMFDEKKGDNTSMLKALIGANYKLTGPAYLGFRYGWLFGDDAPNDDTVLLPVVGAKFSKIDASVGYQILNDFNYINLRVGIFVK